MQVLKNRRILLGISGSIAAYKTTFLVREFIKRGAEVQVVITESAKDFVTPLSLSTLSTRPVYSKFIEDEQVEFGVWNNHVDMGLWADYMVIAPASSNTLSKLASGACDNLLTAVYLSAKCPVFVAPAMDLDMYANGATQDNLNTLKARGVQVIDSTHGELASGLVGKGRMAEPEDIAGALESYILERQPLSGKKVLINAGPTHEHLDPVRFIGNNSTGKMGVSLAQAARRLGAEVHLVLGPTSAPLDLEGLVVERVVSAQEMLTAMQQKFEGVVLTICTAAVSDYRPNSSSQSKLKKQSTDGINLELVQNPDILATLCALKTSLQKVVGFALETENGSVYAKEKLVRKKADAIVLNTLSAKTGFESNTNEVKVYFAHGTEVELPLQDKERLGEGLMQYFVNEFGL